MIDQKTLKLFDELYYESYQDVLKYVIVNCSNYQDVKDIIQNIYLDILKKLKKSKTLISKSYIMGIAKNKVKDYYRFSYKNKIMSLFSSIKDQDEIELINVIDTNMDIEENILKEERITFIWEYLKKQDVIIFKVFYLYYYMDYTLKEISNELNISESNVKNYFVQNIE